MLPRPLRAPKARRVTAYTVTASLIGLIFCAMAVAPSLWPRKGKR